MRKSIYDETLLKLNEIANHLTLKQWLEMISNIELIRKHLQEALRQEKLLELYRYISENAISYDLPYDAEDEITSKIDELEKQIKELENDK